MAAPATSAEQLKPQFRFHYAGDLPVYATSAVNAIGRDASRKRDLEGVRFAEIPWLTAATRGEVTPLDTASAGLVSARRQPRLFALGYDAYGAISHISNALAGNAGPQRWRGGTGELTLRAAGDIRRRVDWAAFERGSIAALPALDPRVDPLASESETTLREIAPDESWEADPAGSEAPGTPAIITLDQLP
jgi:outer membrane PBP1 activator LpoA protein